jgi:hypothetical protein
MEDLTFLMASGNNRGRMPVASRFQEQRPRSTAGGESLFRRGRTPLLIQL